MNGQEEVIDYLNMEWDKVISAIRKNPDLIERNKRLVRFYEDLLEGFASDGIDISEARDYQERTSLAEVNQLCKNNSAINPSEYPLNYKDL